MDAFRILNNARGIAIVYIAILLVVFITFSALVADLGFKFVTKSQLQNAADAGALAGADHYKNELIKKYRTPGYVVNDQNTKLAAKQFAEANAAAAAPVQIAYDSAANIISSTNDITLGFWSYSTHYYADGTATPVNAVKVRARRTSDSPAGPVSTFFGKIAGFDSLNTAATAIAALPPGAGLYMALCDLGCKPGCVFPSICDLNPPIVKEKPTGTGFNYENALTWTTLTTSPSSASEIGDMVCADKPYKMVCNKPIYTNTGSINSQFQNLESVMYNPSIDFSNKDIDTNGKVTGWWVILPVLEKDPLNPLQCLMDDNRKVVKYALVRIAVVCSSGSVATAGTVLCTGTNHAPNVCGGGKPYPNDSLVIDKISCIDCNDQIYLPGLKAQLVQ